MIDIDEMSVGDYVIIEDNSEWHGLIGIIRDKNSVLRLLHVMCVAMPLALYVIHDDNKSKIRKYIKG